MAKKWAALLLAAVMLFGWPDERASAEWPSGWNSDGKSIVAMKENAVEDEDGNTLVTMMHLYSDKVIVRFLDDRPITVTIQLAADCYTIWVDRGAVVDTPLRRVVRMRLDKPNWEKTVRGCQVG